jgi:hypothetical protein
MTCGYHILAYKIWNMTFMESVGSQLTFQKKHVTSIFRPEESEKKQASKKQTEWLLILFTFRPWSWRQHVPPKRRWTSTGLRITLHYNPEESTLLSHRCEILIYKLQIVWKWLDQYRDNFSRSRSRKLEAPYDILVCKATVKKKEVKLST